MGVADAPKNVPLAPCFEAVGALLVQYAKGEVRRGDFIEGGDELLLRGVTTLDSVAVCGGGDDAGHEGKDCDKREEPTTVHYAKTFPLKQPNVWHQRRA